MFFQFKFILKAWLAPMSVDERQYPLNNDVLNLMDKIDDSLQSTVPSSFDGVLSNDIADESGSSKYNESWPNSLPSFNETPPKATENNQANTKEHSIEDFIEERNTTMSKYVISEILRSKHYTLY